MTDGTPTSGEEGTISMFTVFFTIIVFLLAGLLVDGGLAIHARQRAADIAEEAARAGANNIDINTLRAHGKVQIIEDGPNGTTCAKAKTLINAYTAHIIASTCDTPAGANRVDVTVTISAPLQFLSIVPNFQSFVMTGKASAQPQTGN
jgi:Flp pilus assembly protein TadG